MSFLSFPKCTAILALLAVASLKGGCAAAPTADTRAATPRIPWWVASPSAPLPERFPAPGPVNEVIIKEYPSYRAAIARPQNSPQGTASTPDSLFYPLFNHIKKNHIEMSSPVAITYNRDASGNAPKVPPLESMAFIYGSPTIGNPGTEGAVEIVDVPAMTVISVGITGPYDLEHFYAGAAILDSWLKAHVGEYAAAGPARCLAYNSPFVLSFMRYAEVQIPVNPVQK